MPNMYDLLKAANAVNTDKRILVHKDMFNNKVYDLVTFGEELVIPNMHGLLNAANVADTDKHIIVRKDMFNDKVYNGSEPKVGVTVNGKDYILKRKKKDGWNNVRCEYIASHVINALGGNAHNTLLGLEGHDEVVLCEDFTQDGHSLKTIAELNESSVDTDISALDYFYSDIIYIINHLLKCDPSEFAKRFLEMYVFDTILGNPDRHMGNWGVYNNSMAPIFDNGASLFPRANIDSLSIEWMEERIKVFPNSKIMFGTRRERSSYYDMWKSGLLPEYAIDYANSLDIAKALDYISSEPCLSNKEKQFYSTVVYNRYNCIIKGGTTICLM